MRRMVIAKMISVARATSQFATTKDVYVLTISRVNARDCRYWLDVDDVWLTNVVFNELNVD